MVKLTHLSFSPLLVTCITLSQVGTLIKLVNTLRDNPSDIVATTKVEKEIIHDPKQYDINDLGKNDDNNEERLVVASEGVHDQNNTEEIIPQGDYYTPDGSVCAYHDICYNTLQGSWYT